MEDLGLPIAFNSAFLERSVPPAAKSAFHQEQQSQVLPPLQPGQQVLIAAADQADTLTNTATASRVAFGMKPDVFGRPSAPNKKAEREGPLCFFIAEWNGLFAALIFAEGPLVVDDRPSFLFVDRGWDQRNHTGSGAAVLDHPEELAIFALLVKFAVGKITRAGIEDLTGRAVSLAFFAMAVKTRAFSLE
jgi:hypothetical protein